MRSNSPRAGSGFRGINPVSGEALDPEYFDARLRDIDAAMADAAAAGEQLRAVSGPELRRLLEAVALALESRRGEIIARCQLETGYPPERVIGEFVRMVGAMRMFGDVALRGDWLDARIDRGDPSREALPKPDLRRMNVPVGPVVVFGASNFPLALSVAGSDVASALAAGCPVVVKGHPSHPGTSALLASAIREGVAEAGFPSGTFAMLQGESKVIGQALVEHPEAKAVAFTGSHAGGRAIFDLAARREIPIPVYAEMGSVNPQFVFPDLLANDALCFAGRLFGATTVGNGQFCTNPGLVFLCGDSAQFMKHFRRDLDVYEGGPLLNAGIRTAFEAGIYRWRRVDGLEILHDEGDPEGVANGAGAVAARISLAGFERAGGALQEEVFGPATLFVECESPADYVRVARRLGGQLAVSLHGTGRDLGSEHARELLSFASTFAGRVLVNQCPTGLEPCHALQHGGPYPATTNANRTAIGTAAIERFGRPVAFQNVPDEMLPDALKEANPLKLRRLVDGVYDDPHG